MPGLRGAVCSMAVTAFSRAWRLWAFWGALPPDAAPEPVCPNLATLRDSLRSGSLDLRVSIKILVLIAGVWCKVGQKDEG